MANSAKVPLFSLLAVKRQFRRGTGVLVDRLEVPAGVATAILGATGSGKSTLLNLLGGLEAPEAATDKPELLLNLAAGSTDLMRGNGLGKASPHVAFVFQSGHLMRDGTVSANLAMSSAAAGRPICAAVIEDLCDRLELRSGISADRARVLSGGEAQRVAVARALLRSPEVVLADEPTASLDPRHASKVMAALIKWQRTPDSRHSLIWVTHNYGEAAKFADRIIVLSKGQVVQGFETTRPNPHDPLVLQAWVDGRPEPKSLPATIERVCADAREVLSCSRIEIAPNRSTPRRSPRERLALAGKLAASEIFSNPNIDSDQPQQAWLLRLTTFGSKTSLWAGMSEFVREKLAVRSAGFAAALTLAAIAQAETLKSWLPSLASWIPPSLTTWFTPWRAFIALMVALLGAIISLFWPMVRRAEGLGQVCVYVVLLLSIATLEQGRRSLDESFKARLQTPELSHVLVSGGWQEGQLTLARLADIGCEMEAKGLASSGPTCDQRKKQLLGAPFPPNNYIFGRWEMRNVQVAKRTKESFEGKVACRNPTNNIAAVALVADPNEPVFGMIPKTAISDNGNTFKVAGDLDLSQGATAEAPLVAVNRGFFSSIFGDGPNDPFMCVRLREWHVVRISHILDQIPSDGNSHFHLLLPPPLYMRDAASELKEQQYAAAAIYVPFEKVDETLGYIAALASRQGEQGRQLVTAEAGFRKIRAAVDVWSFSKHLTWIAILAALGLSAIQIVLSAANKISENDKGLCVMRAFGMKFWDIYLFVWLQSLVLFVFSALITLCIVYLSWPLIAPAAASILGVSELALDPQAAINISIEAFAIVMTVSCFFATVFWWRKSRFVARRLQRLA